MRIHSLNDIAQCVYIGIVLAQFYIAQVASLIAGFLRQLPKTHAAQFPHLLNLLPHDETVKISVTMLLVILRVLPLLEIGNLIVPYSQAIYHDPKHLMLRWQGEAFRIFFHQLNLAAIVRLYIFGKPHGIIVIKFCIFLYHTSKFSAKIHFFIHTLGILKPINT